eukprot:TRINITY_DN64069_c0_g1_i1.p1 TRINITY_DN64069_c0_g1~~TRINITY_DN64069_c0_g1_i1.p1  ORF type:complete len:684 (+),score=114.48 TRINITY_DN64069_c0_g1_i1:74-2053(+)
MFSFAPRDPIISGMEAQINSVCAQHNPNYRALFVSWNDNSRQQGSCWGNNITDARLKGKDGEDFLVVRPQNFNEKIGKVRASDIALLVGGQEPGVDDLRPSTLEDYLRDFSKHASYAGSVPEPTSLLSGRDQSVGIRFQAVFLPVPAEGPNAGQREFYPDTYNYQTRSWDDPRNIVLLCTSQGTFVQQDGPNSVPQYLHQKSGGSWRRKYLEALKTRHGVSMGQVDTEQERLQALQQGKAVSTVIGTRSMGLGFNRLMTVQVPMKQQKVQPQSGFGLFGGGKGGGGKGGGLFGAVAAGGGLFTMAAPTMGGAPMASCNFAATSAFGGYSGCPQPAAAHAARVSYGSDAGLMEALKMNTFERDHDCSITITVQFYFVVDQGRPICEADIKKAIDICEEAYKGCSWDGKLMDAGMQTAFAKKDLTTSEAGQIVSKIITQPPGVPSAGPGIDTTTFPSSQLPGSKTNDAAPPSIALGSVTFDPFAGVGEDLKEKVKRAPLNKDGYDWLFGLALARLERGEELDISFHLFRLANDLHLQLLGKQDPIAMYNMACCYSVAVSKQIKQYREVFPLAASVEQCVEDPLKTGGVIAIGLSPGGVLGPSGNVSKICQGRLDAALACLSSAVGAGYNQHAHAEKDPDLEALRELRSERFQKLLKLMQAQ